LVGFANLDFVIDNTKEYYFEIGTKDRITMQAIPTATTIKVK
jgi:hypothetical protein